MTIAKPRSQSGVKNAESSFIAGAPDAKGPSGNNRAI